MKTKPVPAETFVARWRSAEGCFIVIARSQGVKLHVVTQGHPCVMKRLRPDQARYFTRLDYPLKKAARKMRSFAKHNSSASVRRFLEGVINA